jgi:D-alanyl-D-alanine carboxypeptidase
MKWFQFTAIGLLSCGLLTGFASCIPQTQYARQESPPIPFSDDLQAAIDRVIFENQEYQEIGISVAVIAPGYQPWKGVSGFSQRDVPISEDMLFDSGSIQKNLQAALVLKLIEEGQFSLDDRVTELLPVSHYINDKTTIRHLLNHSSGIFNVFEHPDFPWIGMDVDYAQNWAMEEVFEDFVLEPYGPPGEIQHYSSTNTLLLTSIIEQATGKPVSDEVSRYFLEPLDLDTIYVSDGELPPHKFLIAHPWVDIDRDGNLEDLHGISLNWKVSLTHPALFSTASDLANWINLLYHDQTVLEDESLDQMLLFPDALQNDPEGYLYGLGVIDYSSALGEHAYGHAGSSLGYSSAALYLPHYGISIAWLINTGESPPELGPRIMFEIWSAMIEVVRSNVEG